MFFPMKLPEVETGPRDVLIADFLKRCWNVLRERGQAEPALFIDLSGARDNQGLTTELAVPSTEALEGGYPPKVSAAGAVGAPQPLSGMKLVESPAKFLVPGGGYPLGSSTPTAATTPAKLASLSEAEEDVAYDARAAQLAEYRANEIAAINGDIAKREADREVALAALKRVRLDRERLELERVATENFVNERKRRHDRLEGRLPSKEFGNERSWGVAVARGKEASRRVSGEGLASRRRLPSRDLDTDGRGDSGEACVS
jgi:hypothetical protein